MILIGLFVWSMMFIAVLCYLTLADIYSDWRDD